MKESGFWAMLRERLVATGMLVKRVENSSSAGMPDVNAAWNAKEVWLELKVFKGRRIEVRYSQVAWLRKRLAVGMNNTYFVALDGNEIKVWEGAVIHRAATNAVVGFCARETEKSIIFEPPSPSLTIPRPFTEEKALALRNFLFDFQKFVTEALQNWKSA
jgi:Holliday junction resolvase